MLNDDLGRADIAMAPLSLAGAVADTSIALNKPEPVVETVSTNASDVPPTEPAPVQVATADPSDLEPGDAGKAVSSIEIVDECLVVDICVDRYLWTLYQRTPKEDSIKELERRKVAVKRKGKMVTVARTFTKLVDEDFEWKDPKAAERARHVDDGLRDRRHGSELQAKTVSYASRGGGGGPFARHHQRIP